MYSAQLAGDPDVLNQTLLPYRKSPVYLRLVDTESKAKDYAAGGFHISVTRGGSGGCKDAALDVGMTKAAICTAPLGRQDLTGLWNAAANAYLNAYNRLGDLSTIKTELLQANILADAAYAMEGVDPPRDPVLVAQGLITPAEPVNGHEGLKAAGLGLAFAAILGGGIYAAERKSQGKPIWPWGNANKLSKSKSARRAF